MRYDEITKTITTSSPDDWTVLASGPVFLDQVIQVDSGTGHWVKVDSHHSLAVYKADVDLRLAWGLPLDSTVSFHAATPWRDKEVVCRLVDALWQGALVARWVVLMVDGRRCYLPNPGGEYVRTGESMGDAEMIGLSASADETALARLLQKLARLGWDFDTYLADSGIVPRPDG